jgi:hypothetical protein
MQVAEEGLAVGILIGIAGYSVPGHRHDAVCGLYCDPRQLLMMLREQGCWLAAKGKDQSTRYELRLHNILLLHK